MDYWSIGTELILVRFWSNAIALCFGFFGLLLDFRAWFGTEYCSGLGRIMPFNPVQKDVWCVGLVARWISSARVKSGPWWIIGCIAHPSVAAQISNSLDVHDNFALMLWIIYDMYHLYIYDMFWWIKKDFVWILVGL